MAGKREKCPVCGKRRVLKDNGLCQACGTEPLTTEARVYIEQQKTEK